MATSRRQSKGAGGVTLDASELALVRGIVIDWIREGLVSPLPDDVVALTARLGVGTSPATAPHEARTTARRSSRAARPAGDTHDAAPQLRPNLG